jgi:hypothetical protein
MIIKTAMSFAFAAACLGAIPSVYAQPAEVTVVVAPPPQVEPGDVNWQPERNVVESQQYERLLQTNPAFRMARIQKECGPITDPQLHEDCIRSFDIYEPTIASAPVEQRVVSSTRSRHQRTQYVGSSTAPTHYQSHSGR